MSDTINIVVSAVGAGLLIGALIGTALYWLRQVVSDFMWTHGGERRFRERIAAATERYRAESAAGLATLGKWYAI